MTTTTTPDPARLVALSVLSAAGVCLTDGLDVDAAAEVVRRELDVAAVRAVADLALVDVGD